MLLAPATRKIAGRQKRQEEQPKTKSTVRTMISVEQPACSASFWRKMLQVQLCYQS